MRPVGFDLILERFLSESAVLNLPVRTDLLELADARHAVAGDLLEIIGIRLRGDPAEHVVDRFERGEHRLVGHVGQDAAQRDRGETTGRLNRAVGRHRGPDEVVVDQTRFDVFSGSANDVVHQVMQTNAAQWFAQGGLHRPIVEHRAALALPRCSRPTCRVQPRSLRRKHPCPSSE